MSSAQLINVGTGGASEWEEADNHNKSLVVFREKATMFAHHIMPLWQLQESGDYIHVHV